MITEMIPLYCVIAISLLTLLVTVGIAWEIRRVDSHVLRILDARAPGEPAYKLPVYPPLMPQEYAAQARAYYEEQMDRVARAEDVGALVGDVDGLGKPGRAPPEARARRPGGWVTCSTDGEHIGEPVVRSADEAGVYRAMPALGEDEEDTQPSASTERVKR